MSSSNGGAQKFKDDGVERNDSLYREIMLGEVLKKARTEFFFFVCGTGREGFREYQWQISNTKVPKKADRVHPCVGMQIPTRFSKARVSESNSIERGVGISSNVFSMIPREIMASPRWPKVYASIELEFCLKLSEEDREFPETEANRVLSEYKLLFFSVFRKQGEDDSHEVVVLN